MHGFWIWTVVATVQGSLFWPARLVRSCGTRVAALRLRGIHGPRVRCAPYCHSDSRASQACRPGATFMRCGRTAIGSPCAPLNPIVCALVALRLGADCASLNTNAILIFRVLPSLGGKTQPSAAWLLGSCCWVRGAPRLVAGYLAANGGWATCRARSIHVGYTAVSSGRPACIATGHA